MKKKKKEKKNQRQSIFPAPGPQIYLTSSHTHKHTESQKLVHSPPYALALLSTRNRDLIRHDLYPPGGSKGEKMTQIIMVECNKICDLGYGGSSVEGETNSTQREVKVSPEKRWHKVTHEGNKNFLGGQGVERYSRERHSTCKQSSCKRAHHVFIDLLEYSMLVGWLWDVSLEEHSKTAS